MNSHTLYLDNLKVKFVDDIENVKAKFAEQERRNAALKAENCLLTQKLVKKDKAILLLSEKDVEEKDTKIKKLEAEIVQLKRQLEPSPGASTPEPGHSGPLSLATVSSNSLKRKRTTSDEQQLALGPVVPRPSVSAVSISAKRLHKFDNSCFGFRITILSQHEVLLYLQESRRDAIIIRTDTGAVKPLKYSHESPIESVHKVANGFVTELANGYILLWKDGEIARKTKHPSFSKVKVVNGEIVAADRNGRVFIMDADWNTIKLLPLGETAANVDQIEGNASHLAIALDGGRVYFYDRRDNFSKMEYTHSCNNNHIMNMAIENEVLATATCSFEIKVWDMKAKKELWKIDGSGDSHGGTLRINKGLVISAQLQKNTKIWQARSGKLKTWLPPSVGWDVDISPSSTLLAVPHKNHLRIWSLIDFTKVNDIEMVAEIGNVRFQTDDKIIVELYNGEAHLVTLKS